MYSEPRRRRKDYDRDRDRERERERDDYLETGAVRPDRGNRVRPSYKSRPSSSKEKDLDKERVTRRQNSYSSSSTDSHPYSPHKSSSSKNTDRDRQTSSGLLERTRSSQTYPTFSKAHSKESITKSDGPIKPVTAPHTPDLTDVSGRGDKSPRITRRTTSTGAPPSPPLTTVEPSLRRTGSGGSLHIQRDRLGAEEDNFRRSLDERQPRNDGVRFSASRNSLRKAEEGRSSLNIIPRSPHLKSGEGSPRGNRSPLTGSPTRNLRPRNASQLKPGIIGDESNVDSDATAMPNNSNPQQIYTFSANQHNGSTDVGNNSLFPSNRSAPVSNGHGPELEIFASVGSDSEFAEPIDSFEPMSPIVNQRAPPPPPPPPAFEPVDIPQVDYLISNGGLSTVIMRSFSTAVHSTIQQRHQPKGTAQSPAPLSGMQSIFVPYQTVLDDLDKVISMNGSVAVATGYRSAARKAQEQLESVFARNLRRENCSCIMCEPDKRKYGAPQDQAFGFGELLELLSGRTQLPHWPPFVLPTTVAGLGISDLDAAVPMQKLDVDVPDEFREHYLRQSKKTKHAVQSWLANQPEDGPPTEADDETLTFAMLTYLEPEKRPLFTALSRGLTSISNSRAPTPAQVVPKSDFFGRIGMALQRLYRLSKPPREPESCMFLIKNPSFHNTLTSLALLSNSEWDLLISGQFGTDHTSTSQATTPFSPGGVPLPRFNTPFRSSTPNSTTANPNAAIPGNIPAVAVQKDEEVEIAMLAEVERDIYLGMEALEDAFERLHLKAEAVRKALMARSAGLAAGLRQRDNNAVNGGSARSEDLGARLNTPILNGIDPPFATAPTPSPAPDHPDHLQQPLTPDPDWTVTGAFGPSFDDTMSLVPDDSASNIGWRERERRQRDRERSGGVGVGWRGYDGGANGRANGVGGSGAGLGFAGATKGLSKRLTRRLRPEVVREEG